MKFVLLLAFILVGALFWSTSAGGSSAAPNVLKVHFLDVGQGDAVLIESPSGTQVLIDGGPNNTVLRELTKVLGFFDRHIDLVIATHGDQDHIGGLVDVLTRYEVDGVLMTENESDTPVGDAFYAAVEAEGSTVYYARRGQVYDLGRGEAGSTTLTILFPDRDPRGLESNLSSIVAKLSYGDMDVMLTGDSPKAVEEYLVELYGTALESEVVKAGHHGSDTSSSESFLRATDPVLGVFSAGKDNAYGHPHRDVVALFAELGIETQNTAEVGSVLIVSDGNTFEIR